MGTATSNSVDAREHSTDSPQWMPQRQSRMRFEGQWNFGGLLEPREDVPLPFYVSSLGALFQADCLDFLPLLGSDTIDTIFADPPFNLAKDYGGLVVDNRPDYLSWSQAWLQECIRVLRPGGALFVYNLPKWSIPLGAFLMDQGLTFRHWVAVSMKSGLPISGRLYPAHYGLLYFTKGKPNTFRNIRTPIEVCRHCGKEIKDYGGHRGAMNPKGVNLTDVWTDIPPVRHWKFKSRERSSNQLSTKLVSRAVAMSTSQGDIVLDPFGGSGTTFDVCERLGRHWIGTEIQFCDVIAERLESGTIHHHPHSDYFEDD